MLSFSPPTGAAPGAAAGGSRFVGAFHGILARARPELGGAGKAAGMTQQMQRLAFPTDVAKQFGKFDREVQGGF